MSAGAARGQLPERGHTRTAPAVPGEGTHQDSPRGAPGTPSAPASRRSLNYTGMGGEGAVSANCRGRLIGKMSSSLASVARVTSAVLVPGCPKLPAVWPAGGTRGWDVEIPFLPPHPAAMLRKRREAATAGARRGLGPRCARVATGPSCGAGATFAERVGRRGGGSGWDMAGEG